MKLGFHHLAIWVDDLQRAEAFYVSLLGLPVLRRFVDEQGAPRSFWVGLETRLKLKRETAADAETNCFLAIEQAPAGDERSARRLGHQVLVLEIDRGQRVVLEERLAEAGHPKLRSTPFTFYVGDPEGNEVGFSHYPNPSN